MGGWRGDEGCQMWHVSEGSGHHMLHIQVKPTHNRSAEDDRQFIH
jgi:hypothetical protein